MVDGEGKSQSRAGFRCPLRMSFNDSTTLPLLSAFEAEGVPTTIADITKALCELNIEYSRVAAQCAVGHADDDVGGFKNAVLEFARSSDGMQFDRMTMSRMLSDLYWITYPITMREILVNGDVDSDSRRIMRQIDLSLIEEAVRIINENTRPLIDGE